MSEKNSLTNAKIGVESSMPKKTQKKTLDAKKVAALFSPEELEKLIKGATFATQPSPPKKAPK